METATLPAKLAPQDREAVKDLMQQKAKKGNLMEGLQLRVLLA